MKIPLRDELLDCWEGCGAKRRGQTFAEWLKATADDDTATMMDAARELLMLLPEVPGPVVNEYEAGEIDGDLQGESRSPSV
jgi:hypothetical protein